MKNSEESRLGEGFVESFSFTVDRFSDYIRENLNGSGKDLPSVVSFDSVGTTVLDMTFYDGYAYDTKSDEYCCLDRVGLYYPTISEVEGDVSMQRRIECVTGRRWLSGDERRKVLDIANTFGKASRISCPRERYESALRAIESRVKDPSSRSFTPEQRSVLKLAVHCDADPKELYDNLHEALLYDCLFGDLRDKLPNVPKAWIDDAYKEALDMSEGIVRSDSRGLRM